MTARGWSVALLCVLSTLSPRALADDISSRQGPCASQITYLSETDDAYKYLEHEQHGFYTRNPHFTDLFSREALKSPRSLARWADLKALALKACPDPLLRAKCALSPDIVDQLMNALPCLILPTPFESPIFISLINSYTEALDRVRLRHFPRSPTTRFGSLPTDVFQAQAILAPGSKVPLVILNRDIFFFTGALSKAIADSIPITIGKVVTLDHSESAIRQRLHDNPYIVHNFADAIARLVRAGSSAGAIEITLDEDHNHIHARLVTAMDEFLIAHEEAHVILAHVSDRSVEFHVAGGHGDGTTANGSTLKTQLRTRRQELEADALGFKLMIWSVEEESDPIKEMMAAAAPHMVFRILDAIRAYGKEAGRWTFSDANHPSAADRIKALSPVFDELARTSEPLREVDFRVPFDTAFEVLLAESDPLIRQHLGLPPKRPR